ncbi:leucine-rich repeat receptor protein kinase [Seminavis robusta]|uniref:Leucine-rich repeat receptor protein kinase n=1 Tax=Seminavis robusta TaxID=568900 RepID=A0A9N8DI39_9STRA|nr:leucine-rich repeat receptor protein kinase [Seminavis robusta]|eukprot:Sro96_g049690.1 leucine-rich repeat receptor protein kinase (753) ;mRNA; r:100501-102759
MVTAKDTSTLREEHSVPGARNGCSVDEAKNDATQDDPKLLWRNSSDQNQDKLAVSRMSLLTDIGIIQDSSEQNDADISELEKTTKIAVGEADRVTSKVPAEKAILDLTEPSNVDNMMNANEKLKKDKVLNAAGNLTPHDTSKCQGNRLGDPSSKQTMDMPSPHPQSTPDGVAAPPPLGLRRHGSPVVLQSLPGAHHQMPSWRQGPEEEGNSNESSFRETTPEYQMPRDNVEGLAEARPVVTPTEVAEPIDVAGNQVQREQRQQTEASRILQLVLLGICILSLIGVGLGVGLAQRDSSGEGEAKSKPTETTQNHTTVAPPDTTSWTWDLPFTIPSTTFESLHHDIVAKEETPLVEAYRWMRADTYLGSYSEESLLQRFLMAHFYYSTKGKEWFLTGGGTESVEVMVSGSLEESQGGLPLKPPISGSRNQSSEISDPEEPCCRIGILPGRPKGGELVDITSEPWLSYYQPECHWFLKAAPYPNSLSLCNEDGHVRVLDFAGNNLQGTLPAELALLDSLRAVNIIRNAVGGPIFTEIGMMSELESFLIGGNQLTGSVPSEVGMLSTKLKAIDLIGNRFFGAIPTEVWKLSNVEQLKLARNRFTGTVPSNIGTLLPKLKLFFLGKNQFSGTLPSSIGLMTDLLNVETADNKFEGSLPTELGKLSKLGMFHASKSGFSGAVPSELGLLSNMIDLRLNNNPNITGSLPSELFNLKDSLWILQIEGTAITGTIPDEFCNDFVYLSFDCSETLCGCGCMC